jgi:hypothetical protein
MRKKFAHLARNRQADLLEQAGVDMELNAYDFRDAEAGCGQLVRTDNRT